jgi:hypothetical protein
MRTDQLTFEEQPVFERVVTGLLGVGAIVGVLAIPFWGKADVGGATTIAVVTAVALVAASTLRGKDDTLPFWLRVFGVFAATMVGFCCESLAAWVVAMGATLGFAMAGTRAAAGSRQLLGIAAGVGGALWALWAVPALIRLAPGMPVPLRLVAEGVLSGVFVGGALGLLHVRVHADAIGARLKKVSGETGSRLQRVWDRCHQSLRSVPASSRREVLTLLEVNAREAERLVGQLANIDARLVAADRKDAEAQVALLKSDVAQSTDAMTRERLSSAVASLSDSLEALDAMERKRERMGAELKLKLATLERAALALETAQGEPAELKTVVLRLTQSAATA